jgi:hypothetical protein
MTGNVRVSDGMTVSDDDDDGGGDKKKGTVK